MTKKPAQEYNVTALRKSIAVLHVIKNSKQSLGVSEIARRANVSKNMCVRILETLTDLEWIRQHAEGPVYELTLTPFQFFASSRNRTTLLDQALPALKRLNRETGESTYLTVLHQNKALMIHIIKGSRSISVTGEIGASYDLHATAPGKVFLAWSEPSLFENLLKTELPAFTANTIVDSTALRKELALSRERGYTLNSEEYGPGLLGLAAPIFNEDNDVIAAMGIFAPSINIAPKLFGPTYSDTVRAAAKSASS